MSKSVLLAILITSVCATVVAVHWPVLSAQALSFDDDQYLTNNLLIRNPGWSSAWIFLSEVFTPSTVGGYYQPLTMISLMVDYSLGGRVDNLMPFHRTSLILHAANTALIIVLLYLLFGSPWVAAAVGLLFGLHPMTVEPIPWVGERKTLLAAFFALWSLVFYIRYAKSAADRNLSLANRRNLWLYIGCFFFYLFALMSKPTSTPLPALMLLLDFWPLNRLKWRTVLEKIPFFALGAIFAVVTYISQTLTARTILPSEYGAIHIPLILCHNAIFYLYKIIWPPNFPTHYAFPKPLSLSNHMVLAGVIGTCILIPLLLLSLRWTRAVLVGWLFFFIAIFPAMGVIGFTNVIASDKFAYMPSLGILIILAAFLCAVRSKITNLKSRITVVALTVLLVLAGAFAESTATRRTITYWHDSTRLFQRLLLTDPNSVPLHNNLGNALQAEGKLDEAINEFYKVIRIEPGRASGYFNMANALQAKGLSTEAIARYRQALQLKKDDAETYNNLAIALQSQGNLQEAMQCYNQVLKLKPRSERAHYNLGMIFQSQGRLEEAGGHFAEAVRIDPSDAEAHFKLGVVFQAQGKFTDALSEYRKAVSIDPTLAEAHNNLAMLLVQAGQIDDAIDHYRAALAAKPNDAAAHNNLASALASIGRLDEAITQFRDAARLDPNYVGAYFNLGIALSMQSKFADAIAALEHAAELTNYQDAQILSTLANAYASDAQIDKALTAVQKALNTPAAQQNPELAEQIRKQIEAYRK
jgi:tetratricopeptide (TPR) repeat protein